MKSTTLFRLALVASALGAVATAQAYIFTVVGKCDSNGVIQTTDFETSSLAEFGNTFSYGVVFYFNGDFTGGFSNGPSSVTMSGTGGSVTTGGGSYSFSGNYTVDSAANTTIPLGSPGTYSATFDLDAGNYSFSVAGQPVPEPATMAVLGLGGAALMRRRRK